MRQTWLALRATLAGCVALTTLVCAPEVTARAPAGRIALTFDDLPGLTLFTDQRWIDHFNAAIVHALWRHHFSATGFVNEGKLVRDPPAQTALLARWRDAGLDLGNHTYSHASPNAVGAAAYLADIARGEPVTRALLAAKHRKLVWFRHPYLETGSPRAVRDEIDRWLAAHHYRTAPVTIDANDWLFAPVYEHALQHGETARAAEIKGQYLAYTAAMIAWARSGARALFGRDIAHVILLHDTRLNADSIDDLAALLARENLRVVPLATALRDPAYRTADGYAGHDGVEWLERWSDTLGKPLPWDSFTEPPAAIKAAYDKLDK